MPYDHDSSRQTGNLTADEKDLELGRSLHRELSFADAGEDLGEWDDLPQAEKSFYQVVIRNLLTSETLLIRSLLERLP